MTTRERFSDEESERILRRALELQRGRGGLSREELIDAGRGVGLDAAHIDAAIAELRRGDLHRSQLQRWRDAKRRGLVNHALLYVVGNAVLFTIDQATPPDDPWFHLPLIAWTLALGWMLLGYLRGPASAVIDASDETRVRVEGSGEGEGAESQDRRDGHGTALSERRGH